MTASSLTIGIFGAGRIGRVHAATIGVVAGVELAAVADVVADAASALAAEHRVPVRTIEEILGDSSIDAVLIDPLGFYPNYDGAPRAISVVEYVRRLLPSV